MLEALFLLLLILPIWFVGLQITRFTSRERKFEVILPISLFFSINLFIFILNLTSYLIKPPLGIYAVYSGFILAGIILWRFKNLSLSRIDMPEVSVRKLLYLSVFIWAIFLFLVIGRISLSGDPQFYSGIAKSFTRGNFPVMTPWQPDVKLAYHYGPATFMGVLHQLTGNTFDFVQRSTGFLIVLMLAIFLTWVFKRHNTFKSFVIYQLIPLSILITLGNWMIAVPIFPFHLPQNFTGFGDWLSKMPAVNISYEVYGGSIVSLKDMVFFYHEMIAIISFIWILWLSFTYNKNRRIFGWILLTLSLASLSIINELFIPLTLPAIALVIFFREFPFKELSKKIILTAIALLLILGGLIIFQGGVPTGLLTGKKSEYPTLQFFPDKMKTFVHNVIYDNHYNIKSLENTNLQTFQLQQQASRLFLPTKEKWLPFIWFHPSVWHFYFANFIICLVLFGQKQRKKLLICISLLLPAITLSLIYNLSFSLSNYSSRLLGFTYILLGANIALFLVWTLENFVRKKLLFILTIFLTLWLVIPSVSPTLATFFTTGEKSNKLITPEQSTINAMEEWIIKNLPYNARLLNLSNIPSPQTNIGIFIPVWLEGLKSYTMDASPQYYDLIFTLNPTILKQFKMTHILLDSKNFSKLPQIRREELLSGEYFSPLYQSTEERLYKINNKYLNEASELPGTFKEIDKTVIPQKAKVYIDIDYEGLEKRGQWEGLVRAITFALKDRSMFFKGALPSCNNQFYTHQEIKLCGSEPTRDTDYDYLILSYANKVENVCDCKAEIIWRGFDNLAVIWKVLK